MYKKLFLKDVFRIRFYNIKEIPTYIIQIRFLMKHSYDMYACWETFNWFIHTIQRILAHQRYHRHGSPVTVNGLNDYISDKE